MEVTNSPPQANEGNHPAALDQLLSRDENNDLSSFFPLSPVKREDPRREQIKNGKEKPMDSAVGFSREDQTRASLASRHGSKREVKMTKETFPSSPPQRGNQEPSPADRPPKTPSKEGISKSTSSLASSFSVSEDGDGTHLQKNTEKHGKGAGGLKKEEERLPSYEPSNGILSSAFKPPPKKTFHQGHEKRRNLYRMEEGKKRGEDSFLNRKKKGPLPSSCARSPSRSSTATDSCETRVFSTSSSSSSLSSSSSSSSVLGEKEEGRGRDREEVLKRNFIKENAQSAGQYRSRRRFHESSSSQQRRHENFGKIPEYLTVRQTLFSVSSETPYSILLSSFYHGRKRKKKKEVASRKRGGLNPIG